MTQRTIIVLAALLALLVLLILVSQPSDRGLPGDHGKLVSGLNDRLNDVSAVTITKGGGAVVATLKRTESGWVVAERDDYPANLTKLRAALVALGEAQRIERKTATPEFYERLGVQSIDDAAATGVLVSIQGLPEPVEIVIGDAAGSDYRYARLKDDAVSWLIDRDPDLPRETGDWLAPELLDIAAERVQAVSVTHPGGEVVTVSKTSRDQADFSLQDMPEGRELLYASVANVMGGVLDDLTLEDVQKAPDKPAAAPIISEFRTFDGLVVIASGFDMDDAAWVSFSASFDAEQAADFAAPPGEDNSEAADQDSAEDAPAAASEPDSTASAQQTDVAAEAARLNERLNGWRYQITRFKFDQMTRNLDDLLQAPATDDS